MPQPSNLKIAGGALFLFSAVLLGVGIHHVVQTGTCSSTGYSANYGPVPHCPSGTGWWFAFLFGGIFGTLIGAFMAGALALIFAGIFGAIGFGALSVIFESHTSSGEKLFAAIFGGCFAIVGIVAGAAVIGTMIGSLRTSSAKRPAARGPTTQSAFGTPDATSAFGNSSRDADPIMSAYDASRSAAASAPAPVPRPAPRPMTAPSAQPSPLSLIPALQAAAAKKATAQDPIDELTKLAELHDKGALTDQEFASAKAKLLGKM